MPRGINVVDQPEEWQSLWCKVSDAILVPQRDDNTASAGGEQVEQVWILF